MYYPAMLDIKNKTCLMIGGGKVGARKSKELLACGAQVKVLSPEVGSDIAGLIEAGSIEWIRNSYCKEYLKDVFMCFACTDNAAVNKQAAEDAKEAGVLVNVADSPALSNFTVPAVRRQGSITLAVGCIENPAASRYLADYLHGSLEGWMPEYIAFVHELRQKCKATIKDAQVRQQFMRSLFQTGLTDMARLDMEAARRSAVELMEEYVRKEGD